MPGAGKSSIVVRCDEVTVADDATVESPPEAGINTLQSVYPIRWDGLGEKPKPDLVTGTRWWKRTDITKPPRTVEYYSMFAAENQIKWQLEKLWKTLQTSGNRPQHPDIRFTGRDLKWWEDNSIFTSYDDDVVVFITGDRTHYWIESGQSRPAPPVYKPIGGRIEFSHDRGWDITWRLRHYSAENTYNPVDWVGVGRPGPRPMWDGPPRGEIYPIDKSITWLDMAAVDRSWNGVQTT